MSVDRVAAVFLYVENEFIIQEMMVAAFQDAGFEVLAAAGGAEASVVQGSGVCTQWPVSPFWFRRCGHSSGVPAPTSG
jgi:hypothetical protein